MTHPLLRPIHKTNVKSNLARDENKGRAGQEQERCNSKYRLGGGMAWSSMEQFKPGTVLQCQRPATKHRVHEARGMQWERSNVK